MTHFQESLPKTKNYIFEDPILKVAQPESEKTLFDLNSQEKNNAIKGKIIQNRKSILNFHVY